jgi:hypothetical protein
MKKSPAEIIDDTAEYLKGLVEIGERLKKAKEENKPEVTNQWFNYLQGYIEALKKFL